MEYVMYEHDESEEVIRCPGEDLGGWESFKYPCCDTMEEEAGVGTDPCFVGSHISEYVDGEYSGDDKVKEINADCGCECSTYSP